MTGERGLHAAIGIVLAFSILWTFAILLPDGDSSAASTKPFDGLIVNGNHYVLDTNVDQTSSGQVYKVIHAVTVKTPAKVTTSKNIKRLNVASSPVAASVSTESATPSASTTTSKENDSDDETTNQTRMSSFSYAWFALFVCYHAKKFLKEKNRQVRYGDDFFVKTGLDHKLEYGLEYEDDYSVDTSFYGSISNWSEMQKFDLDDDPLHV